MRRPYGAVRRAGACDVLTHLVVSGLLATTVSLGLAAAAGPAAAVTATNTSRSSGLAPFVYERRVQDGINRKRRYHGLPALRFQACADRAAERWSRHLARNDLFHHQSMTGILTRCDATYAGETLGRGAMSPRRLVRMWMDSPGHRAILLSPTPRRIGIGATRDGQGGWVVAATFIRL